MTVKEVAYRLRVSRACVYQLIERGKLTCHRIGVGRGAIRVSEEDLAAFLDDCRRGETPVPPAPIVRNGRRPKLKHLRLDD